MTNELFIQLREWSRQDDSFSIRDFAKSGMTYKAIYALSKENEVWKYEFSLARTSLACNAEDAINKRKISAKDWSRYTYENDGFLKEQYFEENGVAVPEVAVDEKAFDKWHKERFKIDTVKYCY